MKNLLQNIRQPHQLLLGFALLLSTVIFAQKQPEDPVNFDFAEHKNATLVNMYPNPAINEVNLLFKSPQNGIAYSVTVISIDGKILLTKKGTTVSGSNLVKLNINQYPTGMYYVQLVTPNSTQRIKLAKQIR